MRQRFFYFKIVILLILGNSFTISLTAQDRLTTSSILSVANNSIVSTVMDISRGIPVATVLMEHFEVTRRVDGAAQLQWSSLAERQEVIFYIEHSINNIDFTTVGEVTGHRAVRNGFDYDFLHKEALKGINYYRLRILASDGSQSFTESQKVVIGYKKSTLSIFPNPAIGTTFLSINAREAEKVKVSIIDLAGCEIQSQIVVVKKNAASLDVSEVGRGMYTVIVIRENGEQLRSKLLVAF